MNCMKSLFQIESLSYEDPLADEFIQAIDQQCVINEEFYMSVFGLYPHNKYKNL